MRPAVGEVLHFSEDPTIVEFQPHIAATAREEAAYVWAVDADRAPDYWFPRDCPRAMAWAEEPSPEWGEECSRPADIDRLLGVGGTRVHMIEYGWLEAMRTVELFAYRFDAAVFAPFGKDRHAQVATEPVRPLGPAERIGDLFALHDDAGIELRVVNTVWPWWREVIRSSLGFSGIRLQNARPAGEPSGGVVAG